MVVDLADTAGAWLAPLSLMGLKGAGGGFTGRSFGRLRGSVSSNPLIDFCRCGALHLVGDMGVDVQGGGTGHMADDGGEGLDIHAVLQGGGGEGVAQVMEADVLTIGPFQNRGQSFPHCRWVHGRILFDWGGEHPPGVAGLVVGLQDT